MKELSKYNSILFDIKNKIQESQNNALRLVNKELVELYFNIGKILSEQKENSMF
jgi:hypothetical protein